MLIYILLTKSRVDELSFGKDFSLSQVLPENQINDYPQYG